MHSLRLRDFVADVEGSAAVYQKPEASTFGRGQRSLSEPTGQTVWGRGGVGGAAVAGLATISGRAHVARMRARLHERIKELQRLPYDWDDEGAPPPSDLAAQEARDALEKLLGLGFDLGPEDVDADVLGGLGMYLMSDHRLVWLAFRNSGAAHAILDDRARPDPPRSVGLDADGYRQIEAFLRQGRP